MKAIFLNQAGTLVDGEPGDTEARRIMLRSGAASALRLLARLDYRFIVVSNQDGVAFGHSSETAVQGIGNRLADLLFREQLSLDGYYFCPHHPAGTVPRFALNCNCRSPMPGLLQQAAREHDIDLHASWMVGDVLHDVEAGNRAGCRTMLIDNGSETEWKLGARRLPTRMAHDLYAAALLIANAETSWRQGGSPPGGRH
jgi:D-glycero-D-manno-heptose 1,7-bisphosphate phosphatase